MSILFLEGRIHIGKSTIILNNTRHLPKSDLGGFLCQRLNEKGKTRAFRLVPAEKVETLTLDYNLDIPDIFLQEISGKWIKNEGVFLTKGIELLSHTSSKKLIILDEIGGFELLSHEFRYMLYEVLSGDVPVLGVIKSHENGMIMKNALGLNSDYWTYYEKLRRDIVDLCGGRILNVSKLNILAIENEVNNMVTYMEFINERNFN